MQLFLNFNYEIWRKETLNCTHGSLRDTIEDLRRSLQPKKSAIEALQQLVAEKEQMLEDMRGLLQAAEEKRQAALAELSAKHQKVNWSYTYTRPSYTRKQHHSIPKDWWTEDVSDLNIDLFSYC
ncbi:hypothetical protein GLYMA_18G186501v4 [Glycine max]|nr:hypothetical protein GLYMA_18G186501v4 [Glycine max]KAH1155088.1 hypothetical protein GYH30_050405 [Glycine max]